MCIVGHDRVHIEGEEGTCHLSLLLRVTADPGAGAPQAAVGGGGRPRRVSPQLLPLSATSTATAPLAPRLPVQELLRDLPLTGVAANTRSCAGEQGGRTGSANGSNARSHPPMQDIAHLQAGKSAADVGRTAADLKREAEALQWELARASSVPSWVPQLEILRGMLHHAVQFSA